MKIKLFKIWDSIEDLKEIQTLRMCVQKAYALQKLITAVQMVLNVANKERLAILEEYGEANEAGVYSVSPDSDMFPAFAANFQAVLDEDVEIDEIEGAQLTLADLEGNRVKPSIFKSLDWLIITP